MKTETGIYKEKLISKDSKIRNAAINQLAKLTDIKQLEFLMNVLIEKRIGNGLSVAIKTIGNFQNESGKEVLIGIYGSANDNEKKLIIESLLKLGVFKDFFYGNQITKNIQEQLWALLFGLNSDQLKKIIALQQKEFKDELDFAWKSTKHWRK